MKQLSNKSILILDRGDLKEKSKSEVAAFITLAMFNISARRVANNTDVVIFTEDVRLVPRQTNPYSIILKAPKDEDL